MAEKPVSPGVASSARGLTLGSSAPASQPRFSPISLRRLLPPRLLGPLLFLVQHLFPMRRKRGLRMSSRSADLAL
jgi:hypothetical protein